jgi:uncharacterized metal-binding protein (TIGR02443 family)
MPVEVNMSKPRKRFIAGASCPACKASDTLQLTIRGVDEQVVCVACGHHFEGRDGKPTEATATAPASDSIIGIFKP